MEKKTRDSTPKQRLAQKRNGIKWRLTGAIASMHPSSLSGPMTEEERRLLKIAHQAITGILDNFRHASTELGFKEPKGPRRLKVFYEKTATGYSAYYKNYAAYTTGADLDELKINAVDAINTYLKRSGSSRVVVLEDLIFTFEDGK